MQDVRGSDASSVWVEPKITAAADSRKRARPEEPSPVIPANQSWKTRLITIQQDYNTELQQILSDTSILLNAQVRPVKSWQY